MTALDDLLNTATSKLPLLRNQSGSLSPFTTPTIDPVPTPQAPPMQATPAPMPAYSPPPAPTYQPSSPLDAVQSAMPSQLPALPSMPLPMSLSGGNGGTGGSGGGIDPFSTAMSPILNGGQGGSGSPHTDMSNAVNARQHQLSNGNPTVPSGGPTGSISYASLPGKYGPLVDPSGGPSDLRLQKGALQSLRTAGVPLSAIGAGSYRTYALQALRHSQYPDRFAPAGMSLHEYGLAIDVTNTQIAKYQGALLNHGWYRERSDEPWHFSYGVYTAPMKPSAHYQNTSQQGPSKGGSAKPNPGAPAPTTGKSAQPPAKRVRVTGKQMPNLRAL